MRLLPPAEGRGQGRFVYEYSSRYEYSEYSATPNTLLDKIEAREGDGRGHGQRWMPMSLDILGNNRDGLGIWHGWQVQRDTRY